MKMTDILAGGKRGERNFYENLMLFRVTRAP